jgi:hypothetical protein
VVEVAEQTQLQLVVLVVVVVRLLLQPMRREPQIKGLQVVPTLRLPPSELVAAVALVQ